MKKKLTKTKNITTDQLAVMIKNGFDKTATKSQLEKMDERLKNLEEKFERPEGIPARVRKLEDALEIE